MSFPDDTGDDIPDPMVTNDYEQAYDDIHFGCRGLLWKIMTKDEIARHFTPEKEASFTCTFENDAGNEFLLKSHINNTYVEDGIGEMMRELKELKARVNRTVALVHNCQRCGATLEVDEHKAIFCCKYCGATYLLGAIQPNSVYN